MEREVRYCTSTDGTRIAFSIQGEGAALLVAPYICESFALDHLIPEYAAFNEVLGRGRQIIRLDLRGCGLSQRDVDEMSGEVQVHDLESVIRAAGANRVAILAPTMAGPGSIAFAVRHPELVSRLILWGTTPAMSAVSTREFVAGLAEMSRLNWELGARTISDFSTRVDFPEASTHLQRSLMESVSGETYARMLLTAFDTQDVTELLSQIAVPTLVMHRIDDAAVPLSIAQNMAAQIPGARLVTFEGRSNFHALGNSEKVLSAISAFLNEDPETRALTVTPSAPVTDSALRTVLFTDLVGHTEMMSRLGDDRGREVLREHERITREVLAAHAGTEVKTMGDGFMASFGSVTKAVECAVELQRAFAGHEGEALSVRVGLNAGEPIEEDGDLFGATVILASRIAAKAEGGEILVADTVRGLCSGKGFLFADRGEFVAKGFEDPVRVYDVSWRE